MQRSAFLFIRACAAAAANKGPFSEKVIKQAKKKSGILVIIIIAITRRGAGLLPLLALYLLEGILSGQLFVSIGLHISEIGMGQSLFGSDPLRRIIDQQFLKAGEKMGSTNYSD